MHRYLNARLKDFPGLVPQKLYEGTESGSFYLYMTTYKKEQFNDAPRSKFLKALEAEGVSLSTYLPNGLAQGAMARSYTVAQGISENVLPCTAEELPGGAQLSELRQG